MFLLQLFRLDLGAHDSSIQASPSEILMKLMLLMGSRWLKIQNVQLTYCGTCLIPGIFGISIGGAIQNSCLFTAWQLLLLKWPQFLDNEKHPPCNLFRCCLYCLFHQVFSFPYTFIFVSLPLN